MNFPSDKSDKSDNSNKKRFEDWSDCSEVDCNDCTHYWDDSCSGILSEGFKRPCNSFLATRRVFIPERLKRAENAIKWLLRASVIQAVLIVGLAIMIFWIGAW